ncbi:MAG: hypothetical protein PHQ54_01010, partial [Candidatus Omnitrophica bacterium]|nr:hypothetical protein [Candidatus Omnitrophota bacterium]
EDFNGFIQQHRIPHYKIAGKFIRFSQIELEKYKNLTDKRPKKNTEAVKNLKTQIKPIEYRKDDISTLGRVLEFIRFNDFYIVSFLCIALLLIYILKY